MPAGREAAHAGEEGLLFVGSVAAASFAEVDERGVNRGGFLLGEGAGMGALGDVAEDSKEALDAAVAILEHAEWVVEAAVEFGADLYGHWVFSKVVRGTLARPGRDLP